MTGAGYSQTELDDIQDRWRLRFPLDLCALLRERRSVIRASTGTFDWITSERTVIQRRIDWPLEGFWFDVQHNSLWWPEWGTEPSNDIDRYAALRAALD